MGMVDKDRLEELQVIKTKLMDSVHDDIKKRKVTALELLAIFAHVTGICIALQDKEVITKDMAMGIVIENIEIGNRAVVDNLDNMPELLH